MATTLRPLSRCGSLVIFQRGVAVCEEEGLYAFLEPSSSGIVQRCLAVVVGRTRARTTEWKDDTSLFNSAIRVCPNSAKLQVRDDIRSTPAAAHLVA